MIQSDRFVGVLALAALAGLLCTGVQGAKPTDADSPMTLYTPNLLVAAADASDADSIRASGTSFRDISEVHVPSYQMKPIVVRANHDGESFREEDRIGSYNQPRWTAHRRFATTRIYVRPEGSVEFEQWLVTKSNRGERTEFKLMQEVEIGLAHRLQLDIYLGQSFGGEDNPSDIHVEPKVELRWALADWGVLPGNPTYYIEWSEKDEGADALEQKLLFGGELAPRWHWGTNLVWEHTMGDKQTDELELTAGLSYALIDELLSVGVEGKFAIENDKYSRSTWEEDLRLGPSFQWHITPAAHVDIVPLFGLNQNSRKAEVYVVFGWEF